jgi:predicted HTH transcriptional regulator
MKEFIMDLEDLIRYENENTTLDFKAIQYEKTSFPAFLKDIIAMANAPGPFPRHIIVGLNVKPDGTRDYVPIVSLTDDGIYQQVVRENVEPELYFTYSPLTVDGHLIGVFRITDCNERPYMMKKDFGEELRKGDSFIRKGSHQSRLSRVT